MFQLHIPDTVDAPGADATGAGTNVCAFLASGHRVEHHQAGVIHCTVGVFEAAGDVRFERVTRAEAQAARGAELFTLAQVIVQKQSSTNHPGRA
ncbi:hypothetical protein D3C72_1472600 [compost metagenome]